MKKTLLVLFALVTSVCGFAADGDEFWVNSVEGIAVRYQVISEASRTAQVYGKSQSDKATTGSSRSFTLTIPATVENNGVTYTVTGITNYSFWYVVNLKTVILPATLETVGTHAFYGCGITKLDIADVAAWSQISFANSGANPMLQLSKNNGALYVNGVETEDLVIPGTVTNIATMAFNYVPVKTVDLGEGVQTIGAQAFLGSSLESVTFPATLTTIGSSAFYNCANMNKVNLRGSGGVAAWCNLDFAGGSANPLYSAKNLYLDGTKVETLVIPGSVKTIKPYVFTYGNFKNVELSEGVEVIKEQAFLGSTLESVTFPATLTTIEAAAFYDCANMNKVDLRGEGGVAAWCNLDFAGGSANPLQSAKNLYLDGTKVTELVIPGSVTTVKPYVFNYASIEKITLSEGVQTVGAQCFYHCDNVTELTIPSSLQTVEASAFGTCASLAKVNINSLKEWCDIDFASGSSNPLQTAKFLYIGGEKVTELVIPDDVTAIKPYAFNYAGITSVTIPSTVATIGEEAFYHCENLIDIICTGAPAEVSYASTFDNRTRSEATVYAPVASLADYIEHATWWNQFAQYGAEIMEGEDYTNTEDIEIPSGKVLRVRYSRTFKNNNWQAWFMPFDVEASELEDYFDIAVFDGAESDDEAFADGKLHLGYTYVKDASVLEANKPYIVKLKSQHGTNHQLQIRADIQKIWGYDGVTEFAESFGICEFVGTYKTFTELYDQTPTSNYYQWAMSGGLLCRAASDAAKLQPYRWYLRIAKADVDPAVYSVIDQLISFDVTDGYETAVERIEASVGTDDAWYNLAGQRVERPTKGIYVKNGKKVLF
ncbi:MAG: leucine-rich repeat domain-containing protein [Bacteroidaceae bacterium]|nr:leucine-rich repeat domain-containing protein [Bacteroidaceae bacterium]